MKKTIQELRSKLASEGVEFTPAEVEKILGSAQHLFDITDATVYEYMKNLTVGGIWVESKKRKMSINEMIESRDLIMYIYEYKIGITNPSLKHPPANINDKT